MEGYRFIICDMLLAAELCFFVINAIAFMKDEDHYFYYSSMLASVLAMCLTKRAGVLFAGIAVFIVTGMMMNKDYKNIRELVVLVIASSAITFTWFGAGEYTFIPVVMFIPALMLKLYLGWRITLSDSYRSLIDIICVCVCGAGLAGFMFLFLARSAYAYDVLARFMKDLFSITWGNEDTTGYLCLSYGFFVLASFIMMMVIRGRDGDSVYASFFGHLSIGMIIYSLIMLYVHITSIGPFNENRESLIPRYMIPWEILVVFLVFYYFLVRREEASTISILIGLVIILLISDSGTFLQGLFARHRCIGYHAFEDAGITLESGDMVYYIDEQPYFNYSDREFYYHIAPAKSNFIDQIFFGNNGRVQMNCEELARDMADDRYLHVPYDYLYLQSFDDDFAERYGSLFEDESDIASGRVYRITLYENSVQLQLIQQ
ncbi:MAG: hypothetical protein K5673_08320 [Lachnospiraceae bacterium]|nr:hypothetical protein [Lachnospiraceae bacterium]